MSERRLNFNDRLVNMACYAMAIRLFVYALEADWCLINKTITIIKKIIFLKLKPMMYYLVMELKLIWYYCLNDLEIQCSISWTRFDQPMLDFHCPEPFLDTLSRVVVAGHNCPDICWTKSTLSGQSFFERCYSALRLSNREFQLL